MTIAKSQHQSIMAMFYHPRFDHLFVVSGFFLYIYQKANLSQIRTSFCSVTPFYRLFNCSGYHDLQRMNGEVPVIESLAKFTENAKKYHRGEFLPGQCNYIPDLKLTGKIFFTKKKAPSFLVKSKTWIIGGAITIGVIFAIALYFFFSGSTCKKRPPKGHLGSVSRRNKEKKLKQFLKKHLFGKGKFSKSSSGKTNSTTGSTDTGKRKRNTTMTATSTKSTFGYNKKK